MSDDNEILTPAQAIYVEGLCRLTGVSLDPLPKKRAEARMMIRDLLRSTQPWPNGNGIPLHPDWGSGDEPMTDRQARKLRGLCSDVGIPFDDQLSKTRASEFISELSQEAALDGYVWDFLDEEWSEDLARIAMNRLLEDGPFIPTFAHSDPQFWASANEPMTERQLKLMMELCAELGTPAKTNLSRADASVYLGELVELRDQRR